MTGTNGNSTILLGEDDLEVRSYLETALKCQGYSVEIAEDGDEVVSALQRRRVPVSAVILDVILPRKDGLEALKEIRRFDPVTPIIMIDGTASRPEVVEAMKSGANDFLAKPINPEDLRRALNTALSNRGSAGCPAPVPAATSVRQVLFGTCPQMLRLQQSIEAIGWSDAPVLILGETGSGKEMLAREIHARSPRAKKPILKVNCAALPSELVESELFGYERGAFTGAIQKKPGMFDLADGGTILLDEIGDMDFKLQAKLLQVLQDQEFQRLGGKDTVRVDVRVIAATHRDLEKAVAEGTFRADLYYRLNVISVCVPPLRDRREDILPMAEFLIRKHTPSGTTPVQLPPSLADLFVSYDWPGNIRELENKIRKFLILQDVESVEPELRRRLRAPVVTIHEPTFPPAAPVGVSHPPIDVPQVPIAAPIPPAPAKCNGSIPVLEQLARANREAERAAILGVLKTTNWNRRQAAVLLHVEYKALLYKMKILSIKKEKSLPDELRIDNPMYRESAAALGA